MRRKKQENHEAPEKHPHGLSGDGKYYYFYGKGMVVSRILAQDIKKSTASCWSWDPETGDWLSSAHDKRGNVISEALAIAMLGRDNINKENLTKSKASKSSPA